MATYAIGDIQGCYNELRQLLDKLNFDPEHDQLWLVGDLVNRGPDSLATLRYVKSLGDACITVLGNHDLHLLSLRFANKTPEIKHNLQPILEADDADELLHWLRQRPLAHYDTALDTLMVHAGIPPNWDGLKTLRLAKEVETVLRGDAAASILEKMYGREPRRWSDGLKGHDRLRCIINSLTRIRLTHADGSMDFTYKGPIKGRPANLHPWFKHPECATGNRRIVFGHWSALGLLKQKNLLGLDTGCIWGQQLTAVQLDIPDAKPIQVESTLPKKF
ncbi:MAG: symmetrical bis(5'-nucleosyl)-tetraphosphatase [Gammaproteobacteria bacterium]|jgi:bis(5'-nucleosyl)-tetraphosphatase (symmetrical)|nr:symmetrical bis(5'-nucleosyl)-tetraphosphatase [Gammaproteobacteria bacterium]